MLGNTAVGVPDFPVKTKHDKIQDWILCELWNIAVFYVLLETVENLDYGTGWRYNYDTLATCGYTLDEQKKLLG